MIKALPLRPILLAAVLLAALAIVIFGSPGDAGAQTSTTLIKNTSQSTVPLAEGLDLFDYAQRFRTGGAPHGYVVTSVGLPFRAVADASVAYTVSIHRLVGGGTSPGTRVGQLTRPGSLAANSVNTWTGPGIYLAPNTDYFVVIDSSSGAVNLLSQTASDNEDAGGASGWSIDNSGRFRGRSSSGTWGTSANSLQLQIGGYARAATPLVGTVLQPNQGDWNLGTHDRAQSFRTGAEHQRLHAARRRAVRQRRDQRLGLLRGDDHHVLHHRPGQPATEHGARHAHRAGLPDRRQPQRLEVVPRRLPGPQHDLLRARGQQQRRAELPGAHPERRRGRGRPLGLERRERRHQPEPGRRHLAR